MQATRIVAFCIPCLLGCSPGAGGNDTGEETDPPDEVEEVSDPAGTEPDATEVTPADLVDGFWGPAPDLDTRLLVFDEIWEALAEHYAAFGVRDMDWDASRDDYRPRIEGAESWGRFYQVLSEMLGAHLQDGHTWIYSERVCFETRLEDRPPMLRLSMHSSSIGACVTPLEDGRLLVYRVAEGNPAGLAPGDVILGYDGRSWTDLLAEIASWDLPVCGIHAAADTAEEHNLQVAAVNNAHLFESLDVLRYGASSPESVPTDDLVAYRDDPQSSWLLPDEGLLCSGQIAVPGVEFPWTRFEDAGDPGNGDGFASWGRIEGTNVGYIYLYSWGLQTRADFADAVADLMETDGLVIDQRYNTGGYNSWEDGMALLFDTDHENVVWHAFRDPDDAEYTALDLVTSRPGYGWRSIDADPSTFYDGPIAVLTSPHAASAGDIFPYMMTLHPHARRFGAPTHGSFGGLVCWRCEEPDPHTGDLHMAFTNHTDLDHDLHLLQGTAQWPEEHVILSPADVASGNDTVVEAALSWMAGY